jgi:LmbE family N-acetylglucosaminyl deacetylase
LDKVLPNFDTPQLDFSDISWYSDYFDGVIFPSAFSIVAPMTIFFDRRTGNGTVSSSNPAKVWNDWRGADERWLFVSAHDDDIVIGAGLTLLAGLANGVATYATYFSDGQMGYCSAEQRRDIVRIRREETDRSYEHLGLPKENLFRFTYDDSNIIQAMGRRFAEPGERNELCGGTGLQNSLTWTLRKVRPTRIFLPNHRDLHPDHQAVHADLVVSIFHAQGEIWPELGEPIAEIPKLYEYATYSDFVTPPTMRIRVSEELARRRAESVAMYQSQRQIGLIVESLRKAGCGEYLLEMEFDLIQPGKYDAMF